MVGKTLRSLFELFVLLVAAVFVYLEEIYRLLRPGKGKSLEGEIILVTGSANGLGKEICRELVRSQTNIVLCMWDVCEKDNKIAARELRDSGATFVFEDTVDVSDRNQVAQAAARLRRKVGDVTMLVNNAGICFMQQFLELTPEAVEKTFQTNVIAHFWTLMEFLPKMIQMNRGHIVTTCSTMGQMAIRGPAPYYSTKHAVHGFIECLKDEIAHLPRKSNLKFTTAYPFFINTRMVQGNNCGLILKFKFPSITPFMEASEVAKRIVDGIRYEREYLYIPEVFRIYLAGKFFLPSKLHRLSVDFFVQESGYSAQLGSSDANDILLDGDNHLENANDDPNKDARSFTTLLNYTHDVTPGLSTWQGSNKTEKEK